MRGEKTTQISLQFAFGPFVRGMMKKTKKSCFDGIALCHLLR